jgi:hypothetical protein
MSGNLPAAQWQSVAASTAIGAQFGYHVWTFMHREVPILKLSRASLLFLSMVLSALTFMDGALAANDPAPQVSPQAATYRQWVEEMKQADRGPFSRIRWFCKDGTIRDAKSPCTNNGGGAQHGEWTDKVKEMRRNGYVIANIYEDLDIRATVADPNLTDIFNQMLFEQFLIAHDDGWILRKARYYRGALQAEGDAAGAQDFLVALLRDPEWINQRFLPVRIGARLLPHGVTEKSIAGVRDLSAAISGRDPGFINIRNKIHGRPEAGDAVLVREYARSARPGLVPDLERLAGDIDRLFSTSTTLAPALEKLLQRVKAAKDMQEALSESIGQLERAVTPADRYAATARAMATLRDYWPRFERPESRLALINASLLLEDEHFAQAALLEKEMRFASRRQQLDWLALSAEAAYGAGLLSPRERDSLREQFSLLSPTSVTLAQYKSGLDYAALVPGWATQHLRQHFQSSLDRFVAIEPLVILFPQGQLRGSPLFFYAHLLDNLLRDANQIAGVKRELFGNDVGGGLRGLNAGIARGVLHVVDEHSPPSRFDADGIYLLPETVADLPPVAGILTRGSGNPLSHIQILARNLGIPNVAVDEGLVDKLRGYDGRRVLLAVSRGGAVQLLEETTQTASLFGEEEVRKDIVINVDVDKLDLAKQDFVPLDLLRASDSGRLVGPKAAKLGELKVHYPEAVADGLAIPFGAFRKVLDQPKPGAGGTVFEWMEREYARLGAIGDTTLRAEQTEQFRKQLEDWVLNVDPGEDFRRRLRAAMDTTFGKDGTYGVFVRSDTNVEDLAGFTGAGLNLTLPNVVGFDNVMKALAKVWASPFSARSFAWRQSRMDKPEHTYPAVLLLRSVPNEKSGVMVTQDIDNGADNVLSVAVNEGVGGAVDGQAAESLRIDATTGRVTLLAQATATMRRALPASGGIQNLPVSGDESVLKPNEISQLIALYRDLPKRFPPITDAEGNPAPADIEFGFLGGRLQLFQIRPFLESARARTSSYLINLDAHATEASGTRVALDQVPGA